MTVSGSNSFQSNVILAKFLYPATICPLSEAGSDFYWYSAEIELSNALNHAQNAVSQGNFRPEAKQLNGKLSGSDLYIILVFKDESNQFSTQLS